MQIRQKPVLLALVCIVLLGMITQVPKVKAQSVIESVIVSEFTGLKHGNIYELQNGQIWKQTEVWIWVWVWVRPRVIIYNEGMWKMKAENIDHAVTVIRLK